MTHAGNDEFAPVVEELRGRYECGICQGREIKVYLDDPDDDPVLHCLSCGAYWYAETGWQDPDDL